MVAIGLVDRFAQVLNVLIYIGLLCLLQCLRSLQQAYICYNSYDSRKCTLKTKYDILSKRGRIQSL
ncbi:hypothetical protein APA_3318 [Pseudanabaena sp. lw0831]|nr:hypothetical protein APA_3318 [Pseudanabaena sp. lw0831]